MPSRRRVHRNAGATISGYIGLPDADSNPGPQRKQKVIYWFKQPTPYVVSRFNALADCEQFEFEAWFSEERESDRSWEVDTSTWRFRARYLTPRKVGPYSLTLPIAELNEVRPDIFVSEYDRFNFALGAAVASVLARRVCFRVLPNYEAWSHRTHWRELAKHLLFRAIDGAKTPGEDGSRLATRYGLPRHRQGRVRQSIDVDHYSRARDISPSDRATRRSQLGLEGCVFLFVGRLWFGKGLGDLLSAYKSVRESRDDVSLLIVGDGVDEDRLRLQAGKLDGVVFAGFVQPRDLPSFYALADVFVFPTLGDPNGLVVEEALAAGLPVISTEAAGDIHSRVAEANVGFVVPVSDVNELADRMKVLIDPSVRLPMSEIASQSVSHMRDAGYAKDFCQFVTLVGSTSPRRNVASVALRGIGALALVSAKRWKWTAAPYVHNANYEVQNATDR